MFVNVAVIYNSGARLMFEYGNILMVHDYCVCILYKMQPQEKHTPWVSASGTDPGHLGWLLDDKGVVILCDMNTALSKFKYDRQSPNSSNIGYGYTCNPFPGLKSSEIYNKQSPTTAAQAGQAYLLKDLQVDCKNTPVLGFKLKTTTDKRNYYYDYVCGGKQLKNPETKQTPISSSKSPITSATYDTFALNEHDVNCGNKFLTSFGLKVSADLKNYNYDYVCAENPDIIPPGPPGPPGPPCPTCPVPPTCPTCPVPPTCPTCPTCTECTTCPTCPTCTTCPACPTCPKPADIVPVVPFYKTTIGWISIGTISVLIIIIILMTVLGGKKA